MTPLLTALRHAALDVVLELLLDEELLDELLLVEFGIRNGRNAFFSMVMNVELWNPTAAAVKNVENIASAQRVKNGRVSVVVVVLPLLLFDCCVCDVLAVDEFEVEEFELPELRFKLFGSMPAA